jgi:NADH dehydrogenase FAD-containing subunit
MAVEEMNIHLIEGGNRLLAGMSQKSSDDSLDALKKLGSRSKQ